MQQTVESYLLVSLNLSAAFDTIDHSTLIDRLSHSFGVTDMALSWIHFYLTDRPLNAIQLLHTIFS